MGYFKLTRTKIQAEDWVWIIDHTIQLGEEKVFCVVGIRLSALGNRSYHLSAEDVEPLALVPVKKSTGEVVYSQLEEVSQKTGIPRLIVGDCGSDLKKGVGLFCQKHFETSFIHDIKHKTALLLKKILEHDVKWKKFCQRVPTSKLRLMHTSLAFLAPPEQRSKSRYMNLEILLHWAERALLFLDTHREKGREDFNKNRLIEKLGWLHTFRSKLTLWKELLIIVSTVEQQIKEFGDTSESYSVLSSSLSQVATSTVGKKLASQLLSFVAEQVSKVKEGERLLGSSEVLESAFGKLKNLESNHSAYFVTAQ